MTFVRYIPQSRNLLFLKCLWAMKPTKIYCTKNLTWINAQQNFYSQVTLEYFYFKRQNEYKRLVVYIYCFFSDNCCWTTAGGSEDDAYLNVYDHSFSGWISKCIPILEKVCLLLPHPMATHWWLTLVYTDPL